MSSIRTEVLEDVDQIARYVAGHVVEIATEAIDARGRCMIALAGGSTPKRLYQLLASDEFRNQISWDKVHLFLGDERYVPNDHQDSNFRMARESLLESVPVSQSQVYPLRTELDPTEAASRYESTLRQAFGVGDDEIPAFDLVLLGIGGDAHTASLFPGTAALAVHDRLVIENWVPQQDSMRITFTIPILHAARHTILMASGTDKAEAVQRAVAGAPDLAGAPSQCLRDSRGQVIFAVDRAAATQLER